jgi:murein DD-endopeptidase MepM/ murein hydrolase activator NlpD
MKKTHFTFLYMPEEGGSLRTVRIPKWLVFGALSLVGLLLASAGFLLIRSSSTLFHTSQLAAVEKENAVLKTKIDQYADRVASLGRQIEQNFDFQKKARLLANMDDLNGDVADVGIGGPEFVVGQSLTDLRGGARAKVGLLEKDLDKLMRQAQLQRESYEEIIAKLNVDQKLLDATPSIRPVSTGFVTSRFGRRMDPFTGRPAWHYGVDYSARAGTPIVATADGVVTFTGRWYEFGWAVEISHGNGVVTRYAHCSKLLVQMGQRVKRGEVIARVGSSGRSTAPHLHYEILLDGARKNPLAYVLSGREVVD